MYEQFRGSYFGIAIVVGIYAITVTLLTAFKSKRCTGDCKALFEALSKGVMFYMNMLSKLAMSLSDVSAGIGQETVAGIVHWLIVAVVMLLGMGLPLVALVFGGKCIVEIYRQYCADEISVLVALISLVIVIFFAEVMPVNVLLLFIISHAVYVLIRWYIHGYREARGL